MSSREVLNPLQGTEEYDTWAAEDKGPSILVTSWLFIGLATIFVVGRLYVRIVVYKQIRSDDFYCLAAVVRKEPSNTSDCHIVHRKSLTSWSSSAATSPLQPQR